MNHSELMLCVAITRAGLGGTDRSSHRRRLDDASAVMVEWLESVEDSRFPFTIDEIDSWRINLRKRPENRIKVEIALAHGAQCYWRHRGKGPCSTEIHAGHVVPRSKGHALTVANGQIECEWHNVQRQEMSIEEYLMDTTKNTFSRARAEPRAVDRETLESHVEPFASDGGPRGVE